MRLCNSLRMTCGPKKPPTRPLPAEFSSNGFRDCHQSNKCLALRLGEESQEQTQIIATAIGKPKAKARAIVDVNAESKFTSGCTLSSSNMVSLHGSETEKANGGTKRCRLLARTLVSQKVRTMVLGYG